MAKEKEKVMKHLGADKGAKADEAKAKKHHTHALTITRADRGGHHLTHQMRDEEGNEAGTQTAIAPDNDAMAQQVQAAMADQPPAAGAGPAQAPQPGAAAPMVGQ